MSVTTQETSAVAASAAMASGKVKLPSDAFSKTIASQAFTDDRKGDELKGTAEQRITYAIQIHVAHHKSNKSNLPALNCTSDDDKKTLREHMCEYFVSERPKIKELSKKHGSTVAQEMLDTYTAMTALVKRGMKYAAMCEAFGITWKQFNTELNCLMVKPEMLTPRNATPTGRLLKEPLIALDGRKVTFMSVAENGDDDYQHANATIKHMTTCLKPEPVERAPRTAEEKAIENASIDALAELVHPDKLIAALFQVFVKRGTSEPITAVDLKDESWSRLSTLMMTIDTITSAPGFLKSVDGLDAGKAARTMATARKAA